MGYYWKQTSYNEYVLVSMWGEPDVKFSTYESLWHYCNNKNINAQMV